MVNNVLLKKHYEKFPYPKLNILTNIKKEQTYALNMNALFSFFKRDLCNRKFKILLAGCGTNSPYPTRLANKKAEITAIDISKSSIQKAKLNTFLKGIFNINYIEADIECFNSKSNTKYDFIDSFGVLHHLQNFHFGLMNLSNMLTDDGIIRIMVYSKHARRKIESIRKAFRILNITTIEEINALIKNASKRNASKFITLINNSLECETIEGLADAFLHPHARTFTITDLVDEIKKSDLKILKFFHKNALLNITEEIERLKTLEYENNIDFNFCLFLGKTAFKETIHAQFIKLNETLSKEIFSPFSTKLPDKFGNGIIRLTLNDKVFLRKFLKPININQLTNNEIEKINFYIANLILYKY